MKKAMFGLSLILFFFGCTLITAVNRDLIEEDATSTGGTTNIGGGGTGGTAGSGGGDAGTGGNVGGHAGTGGSGGGSGTGGTGGTGGNAGGGGQGGQGGNPCTGSYLSLIDLGSATAIPSGGGTTTMLEYELYDALVGNPLTTLSIVNNTNDPPDFTTAMATVPANLLNYVRIRCQDPSGSSSYTTACQEPLDQNGRANCTNMNCYSDSSSPIRVLLQVNPLSGASGDVRIGIDPSQPPGIICDGLDQADIHKRTITP